MQPNNLNLNKPAYSVNELLAMLPLGRTSLYAAIKSGKLKATKLGKKTLFIVSDVAAFLSALPAMGQNDTVKSV